MKRLPSYVHRRIYKKHYGAIPKDDFGRSYEIHHIDNNHSNNDPLNLIAIPIQEHYDIHYAQGDWMACHYIAIRMNKPLEEISRLSKQSQNERVKNGTHIFVIDNPVYKQIEDRTHTFLGGEWTRKHNDRMMNDGSHPFLRCGKDHHSYDHTIYHFKNKITGEQVSMTKNDLITTFNLAQSAVSSICSGSRKSHKGWIVIK
jgi:hypothetical protein